METVLDHELTVPGTRLFQVVLGTVHLTIRQHDSERSHKPNQRGELCLGMVKAASVSASSVLPGRAEFVNITGHMQT